jgi:hypothetical protein
MIWRNSTSFCRGVVVLYILKLHGIVELQFMLGCLWKQFVISLSLLLRPWNDCLQERRRDMPPLPISTISGDVRMYNNKWVELSFCLPQKLHKKLFLNILSSIIYFVHSMNEIILTPLTA